MRIFPLQALRLGDWLNLMNYMVITAEWQDEILGMVELSRTPHTVKLLGVLLRHVGMPLCVTQFEVVVWGIDVYE